MLLHVDSLLYLDIASRWRLEIRAKARAKAEHNTCSQSQYLSICINKISSNFIQCISLTLNSALTFHKKCYPIIDCPSDSIV